MKCLQFTLKRRPAICPSLTVEPHWRPPVTQLTWLPTTSQCSNWRPLMLTVFPRRQAARWNGESKQITPCMFHGADLQLWFAQVTSHWWRAGEAPFTGVCRNFDWRPLQLSRVDLIGHTAFLIGGLWRFSVGRLAGHAVRPLRKINGLDSAARRILLHLQLRNLARNNSEGTKTRQITRRI
jgi:hypothetical protein